MKRHLLALIFCLFCSGFSYAAEKKAHLQFVPNTPVNLSSEATIEVNQSLPGLSLSTRGKQSLKATLSISGNHNDLPITHAPLDLTFILKHLKISVRANEEELTFDSEDIEASLYLNQLSKIIEQPIRLHFGKNFKLESGSEEFQQTMKTLPVLQEVNPEALLMDLFLHLFALGGENLTEGAVIVRQFEGLDIPSLPQKVEYTITSIDDYHIHARMIGNIEKQSFSLGGKSQPSDKEEELVNVSLNGTMEGKGRWNRDNAMLYDLEMHYIYTAMFKLGAWEWMMNANITIHNSTKLKN